MSLSLLINTGNIALLATLLATSLLKNPFLKGAIILVVSLLIKFHAGFDIDNVVFFAVLIIGAVLTEKLPFAKSLNILLSVVTSLGLFNAYLWLS
ncbi:MAG: hypothetical protein WC519_02060 [Parcubacteria group bacterium]|jgi:hypothetical protein